MITNGNKAGNGNPAPTPPNQTLMGQAMSSAQNQTNTNAGATPAAAGFSFLRPAGLVQTPMNRNPAAENLTKLLKCAQQIIDDNLNPDMEVKLIPLDIQNADTRIALSTLTVAVRFKANPELGVGMQNLLLAGSVDRTPPQVMNINGNQVEVEKTAAQADTPLLRQATLDNVVSAFGVNPKSVIQALSCTVPREFDVESEKLVRTLLVNATAAAATQLQTHLKGFVDLNLASAGNDASLSIETEYHRASGVDAVGMPVRSDVTITLSAEPLNKQAGDQDQRAQRLATIRAFVNMLWAPRQQGGMAGMMPVSGVSPYQRYAALIRLTAMEAGFSLTPAAQVMALWVAMSARDNGAWIAAFENKSFGGNTLTIGKDIDLKDIGAIGYEVNMSTDPNAKPDLFNTKSASFTRQSLVSLIFQTFEPGAMMALDVPDSGDSTWYNGAFPAAAEGVRSAIEILLAGTNQLTNGNFAEVWPANGQIFDPQMNAGGANRIHFGYFLDANGDKHDIREIDYLAVLNFAGGRNPEIVEQWSNSFNNPNMPVELRLATRLKIMKMMFTDVHITGVGYCLTFSRVYLDALAAAAAKTGLQVRNVSPQFDVTNAQRGSANFNGALLDPNSNSGFTIGSFGNQTIGNANNSYGNRWS